MTTPARVRRAFVAGINGYRPESKVPPLRSAMLDAIAMKGALSPPPVDPLRKETWYDPSTPRWDVDLWCDNHVTPAEFTGAKFRERAEAFLNSKKSDVEGADLLFYFSGHAARRNNKTVLLGPDGDYYSFLELMGSADGAMSVPANSVTIILDCCMSGDVADRDNPDPFVPAQQAILPSNCSILTASSPSEDAKEGAEHGYFTERLLGGLKGAAADILGDVTPLSLYSHVSFALASAAQNPVFKSYSVHTPVLTRVVPQVTRTLVIKLAEYFPADGDDSVELTWHHEGVGPGHAEYDPVIDAGFVDRQSEEHKAFTTGSQLQRDLDHYKVFRDSHLLRTQDGRDFWFVCTTQHEAGSGKSNLVVLTPLGRYYRDLVLDGRIGEDPEVASG